MPQISANRIGPIRSQSMGSFAAEATRILDTLSQDLDREICRALAEDNNALAERLIFPFTRAKKLARHMRQYSGQ